MFTVAILLVQTLAAAAACYGLWLAWRRFRPAPRPFFLTVTFGLLARVAAAEILFWVSYLRMPFARSLQLDDGFWFFGGDGLGYFQAAEHYARMGAGGIFHIPANASAPGFVSVIAWLIYICGDSAFVAILLNCICYLITAAVLIALVRRDEQLEKPGLVGLLALSFAPSLVLWSTQALKDPLTICLIALFVGCCISWQDLWTRELLSPALAWRAAVLAAAVLAILHEITAVRWYVAAALCIGLPLSSLAMFFVSRRRLLASASGIVLSILAAVTILAGAKDYIPEQFNLLSSNRIASIMRLPKSVFTWIDGIRTGYDLTPGATAIGVGPLLAPSAAHTSAPGPAASAVISEMPAPPPPRGIEPAPAQETKKSPRPAASVIDRPGSLAEIDIDPSRLRPRPLPETAWPPPPILRQPAPPSQAIRIEKAEEKERRVDTAGQPAGSAEHPMSSVPAPATAPAPPPTASSPAEAPPPVAAVTLPPLVFPGADPPRDTVAESHPRTVPNVPVQHHRVAAPNDHPPAIASSERPAAASSAGTQKPLFVKPVGVAPARLPPTQFAYMVQDQVSRLPKTPGRRLLAGVIAAFVPRWIAQSAGLISVNGGGSFWFFVEADTVVLDILVAFAAVYFIQLLRRGCVSPALISVGLSWIVLTATLVYSISNFGTLFRMRAMIFAVLAFVPLVMVPRRRQISRDAAGQPAAAEAASIPLTERLAAERF